jgi:hypothetical protein
MSVAMSCSHSLPEHTVWPYPKQYHQPSSPQLEDKYIIMHNLKELQNCLVKKLKAWRVGRDEEQNLD